MGTIRFSNWQFEILQNALTCYSDSIKNDNGNTNLLTSIELIKEIIQHVESDYRPYYNREERDDCKRESDKDVQFLHGTDK